MSIKTIYDTIITRLETVVDLPTLQKENNRRQLGSGSSITTDWCRATLLPARTNLETVGPNGFNEINGLVQVDLFYPADSDYSTSFLMVDAILNKFVAGTLINSVIIRNSYMLSAQTVKSQGVIPNYYQVSIIIEWSLYEQRPTI